MRQGLAVKAKAELLEALRREPHFLEARFLMGLICCQLQEWQEAAGYLEPVAAAQADRFDALYWLGMAKKGLEQYADAIALFKKASHLAPRHVAVYNEAGLCYLALAEPGPALTAFDRGIALNPGAAPLFHNRGLALSTLDRVYEARDAFAKAIQLAPNRIESYVQLVLQLERLGDWGASIKALESGLKVLPDNVVLLNLLAGAKSQNLDTEGAEAIFRQAMELSPAVSQSYGLWLQEQGRFEESVDVLRASLRSLPVQGSAFYGLAEAKRFELDGRPLLEDALSVLEQPALDAKERVYLLYAIAKAYERERAYEAAWSFFDQANSAAYRCYNSGRSFDHDVVRGITDRRIERFPRDPGGDGDAGLQPILIVGMIRSGTTLLDQILSSHPSVGSAGEQMFWMSEADLLRQKGDAAADLGRLRGEYRELLARVGGASERVIDKMPLNYAYLGLVRQVFPKAKIIHMRRNPLDTCVSIYATYFGHGPSFAYHQGNIAFNYLEYMRLMEHWRRVLPADVFCEVDYEELVADREATIRGVVDFCGLPWDDACLRHDENQGAIKTPSRWQARQRVYGTSVERWRNYEPWLGELRRLVDVHHQAI